MNDIIKKNNLIELFLVYKTLFTKKQQEYFSMYYLDDYSLNEIASINNVSRNAVFDAIVKIEKKLETYERNLSLLEKENKINALIKELGKYVDSDKLKKLKDWYYGK